MKKIFQQPKRYLVSLFILLIIILFIVYTLYMHLFDNYSLGMIIILFAAAIYLHSIYGKEIKIYFDKENAQWKVTNDGYIKSEARKNALLAAIPDIIFFMDSQGRFNDYSAHRNESLFIQPEDFLGKYIQDVMPQQFAEPVLANIRKALKTGTPVEYDYFLFMNNQRKDFEARIVAVSNDEVVIFVRDITEKKLSEEKLKENDERLKLIKKIAGIGYWEENLSTGQISFSKNLFSSLSLNENSSLPDENSPSILLHLNGNPIWFKRKNDLLIKGNFENECSITKKYGDKKYYYERIILSKENNKPDKIVGIMQDITEQKISELKISQSQHYYKTLFDGAKDAIILFYPDTEIIIDANMQACEMYGYPKEELIGKTIQSISKKIEKDRKYIINELKKNRPQRFESVHYKKDGTEIILDISGTIINYFGREVILSIHRDVTERKKADEALRLLSRGIEQNPFPIVITDYSGTIEYVNHSFEVLTQYSIEEVKGKNPRVLQSGETPKEVYKELWDTILDKREWRGEFRNKKKDGSFYWEFAVIYPIVDPELGITQFFASKMDITERKELERQLKIHRENLEFLIAERTKRLRESEETFRALSENSADLIMRFNAKLEHLYVNPAVERYMGKQAEEFIQKTYAQLGFEGEQTEKWENAIKKVFESKHEEMIETNVLTGAWLDCRLYPEFNNQGEVVSVITSGRDITRQKLNLEARYRREKLLNGVIRAASRLLSLDPFDVRVNHALELVASASGAFGIYVFENGREDKVSELYLCLKYSWVSYLSSKTELHASMEKVYYHKAGLNKVIEPLVNGSTCTLQPEDWSPGKNATGENREIKSVFLMPIEVAGAFWGLMAIEGKNDFPWEESDISILKIFASDIGGAFTRKFIEDALRNTEEQFRALFDYAPIPYFIMDLKGDFIEVNNSFERTLGYTKKEITKKKSIHNFTRSKEDKEIIEKILSESKNGIPVEAVELVMMQKDNIMIVTELNTFPISLGDKKMILCAVHNVSLRKKTEEEVRMALTHSQELNEMKSMFVSMVSHEFRTPLSTILSSVEILRHFSKKLKDDEKENHFKKITKSIDYLTNLLDDVITINRADSGRLNVKFREVDIIPLLDQLIQDTKASFTETPFISMLTDLRELKVEIDENLFRQIISNLLNNAIKYTPADKKVIITVDSKDGKMIINVIDEGIGIPNEAKKDLFNPFYRAVNTGGVPGSGLGLAVTKRSIDVLNGEISFISKEHLGSTFTIAIPLKRGDNEKNIIG